MPVLLFLLCLALHAQESSADWLNRAYDQLRAKQYDSAVESFERGLALDPKHVAAHKDLAYTLLRIGETERARDVFRRVMELDPTDRVSAREYGFLCFETRQEAEARHVFERLAKAGDADSAAIFQRIDRELVTEIERWKLAIQQTPDSFSAHEELARLAERRDEFQLAAQEYAEVWRLRPGDRRYLLDLGRVWHQLGDNRKASSALLAASRGAESRTAEAARALMPSRYPWVSEFRDALALDPENGALHRELAFLLLEMNERDQAEAEFRQVTRRDGKDAWALAQLGFLLLGRKETEEGTKVLHDALEAAGADEVLKDRIRAALQLPRELRQRTDVPAADPAAEARLLAKKSLEAGYLKDAARYLRVIHENDPLDFDTILNLGWTLNSLKDDTEAIEWFRLAKRSPDPAIASEANKAYTNLEPEFARVRTSVWAFPVYSSRWHDLFAWAQSKTEFRPNGLIVPYVSVRFAGDVRQRTEPAQGSALLSENAFIPGAGVSTRIWHGLRLWGEAGYAMSYVEQTGQESRFNLDLRGGVSFSRGIGHGLSDTRPGLFAETNVDMLYLSRYDHDALLYTQSRGGFSLRSWESARLQFTWNLNINQDVRRFAWANSIEMGPGIRIKLTSLPRPIVLTVDALRGHATVLDNTRPPQWNDMRIGLWYAFSH